MTAMAHQQTERATSRLLDLSRRWFLFATTILIPAIGFLVIGSFLIEQNRERTSLRHLNALRRDLEDHLTHAGPVFSLQTSFETVATELSKCSDLVEQQQVLGSFSAKQDGRASFYLFDNQGNLASPDSEDLPHHQLLSDMWLNRGGNRGGAFRQFRSLIFSIFGQEIGYTQFIKLNGENLLFSGVSGEGLLRYTTFPDRVTGAQPRGGTRRAGLLMIAWQLPALEVVLAEKPVPSPESILLLELPDGTMKQIAPAVATHKTRHPGLPPVMVGEMFHGREGWMWARQRQEGNWFLLGKRDPELQGTTPYLFLFFATLAGMLFIGAFAAKHLLDPDRPPGWQLGIRPKLACLFLFAALVPILGLASLGLLSLQTGTAARRTRIQAAAGRHLLKLDQGFSRERSRTLKLFRELRDHPGWKGDLPSVKAAFQGLTGKHHLNWVEARDLHGRVVFTTQSDVVSQQIGVVNESSAIGCVERFLQERLAREKRSIPKPSHVFIQSVIDSPFSGWAEIYQQPDRLHDVRFGAYGLVWFWDIFPDPTHPAAVIQGDQKIKQMIPTYLDGQLSTRRAWDNSAFRCFAFDETTAGILPAGASDTAPLQAFARRVQRLDGSLEGAISWNGKHWLAVGIPGNQLTDIILLALFPQDRLLAPMEKQTWNLIYMTGLFLLFATIIWLLVSSFFLQPLEELHRGVQALQLRDASVRLHIPQRDELGDLADLFNRTMEEIKDLLYAQAIQEQLIPREPPPIQGYEASLKNIPAADLGGDYCDVLTLAGGRILFLIGDVTGHGVSSALVMAMAKTSMVEGVDRDLPLLELMNQTNRTLFRLLRRKKVMTLFAAILDPETGELTYSNAGHPIPLLLIPGHEPQRLELFHPPLGFSERSARFETATTHMPPESMLLFYTDAMIEQRDESGNPIGPKGFANQALQLVGMTAREARDHLVELVFSTSGTVLPDDDVTVMVVTRLKT